MTEGTSGRLTNLQDRETYASLISYFRSLPPNDELFQLAELLGLLSLVGQRVPDAVLELLTELRRQTAISAEYHRRVDERLSKVPEEISAGIDVESMAKALSEAIRQQLSTSGMRETAAFINELTKDIRNLIAEITATLKPFKLEYKSFSSTISADLAKLRTASRQLAEHHCQLMQRERSAQRLLQGMVGLLLFLVGGLCVIIYSDVRLR